jgi:thiol:disulfide interchange protein DsbA
MGLTYTRTKSLRRVAVSLLALALIALAGCGNSEPTPPAKAAGPAKTTAAGATTQNTNVAAAPTETDATAPPEQVSETDDGAESTTDSPAVVATSPVLKLASAATPEPKTMPSAFKEGVHYQRLLPTQPTSAPPGKVEVVEVFWYGCPHCFALESKLEAWRLTEATAGEQKGKPSYVVFQRLPSAINDTALFHARVFYAAELLGKLDTLHTQIFREIHLNGNPLNTMDKAKAFFTAHGVAQAEFDKVFESFALESKLQNANMLVRRYRITGVPTFVVNGKFTTDVASAGGEDQLLQLLNELAAREHIN